MTQTPTECKKSIITWHFIAPKNLTATRFCWRRKKTKTTFVGREWPKLSCLDRRIQIVRFTLWGNMRGKKFKGINYVENTFQFPLDFLHPHNSYFYRMFGGQLKVVNQLLVVKKIVGWDMTWTIFWPKNWGSTFLVDDDTWNECDVRMFI